MLNIAKNRTRRNIVSAYKDDYIYGVAGPSRKKLPPPTKEEDKVEGEERKSEDEKARKKELKKQKKREKKRREKERVRREQRKF